MFRLFLKEKISGKSKSTSKSNKKNDARRNRRIHDRFSVDHKHLTMMNEQDIFVIREISSKGFSTNVSPRGFERLKVGDEFSARIRYLGELYDLDAKISWKSGGNTIGFELIKAERRAMDFLQRLLQPIAIANSLKKVDASFMNSSLEGKTWYHGDHDSDLYVWHDEDQRMTAWQFVNSDQFMDWRVSSGLRSGHLTIAEESVSGVLGVTKDALQQIFDNTPNPTAKQFVIDVVMATDFPEKEQILSTLLGI